MSENVEFKQHTEFIEYLEMIGIGEILQKKIEECYNFFQIMCSEDPEDIFIDEYINADGERVYQALNFFSENFLMSSSDFIKGDDFFMNPIKNNVNHWDIQKRDYDFVKANEKSRMNLHVLFKVRAEGTFKASIENCDHLLKIMMKHIVTNYTQS